MKKIYLLFLIAAFSYPLIAQPEITSAIAPEIGDTWTITFMEVNSFDPGLGGGVAQTWDFSNLDLSNTIDLGIEILDPTMIPSGPSFPTADFVWYINGFEIYNYYEVETDSISLVGGASIQSGSIDFLTDFIDPEDGLQLPIAHGDSYTYYSLFEQSVFGTSLGTKERTGMVVADGYGTLITPNGSYENILRLVITETSFGFTSTQYAWFDVNNFIPVFLYEESDDPDTPASLYFSTPNIASPTIEVSQKLLQWNAWFDKGAQNIVVNLPDLNQTEEASVHVYTIDGQLIKREEVDFLNKEHHIEWSPTQEAMPLIISLQIDGRISSQKILALK